MRYFNINYNFLNLLVLLWGVDMCTTLSNTIDGAYQGVLIQHIEILINKNCG